MQLGNGVPGKKAPERVGVPLAKLHGCLSMLTVQFLVTHCRSISGSEVTVIMSEVTVMMKVREL